MRQGTTAIASNIQESTKDHDAEQDDPILLTRNDSETKCNTHLDSEREVLCPTYPAQIGTLRNKTAEEGGYDIILMNKQKRSEEGKK